MKDINLLPEEMLVHSKSKFQTQLILIAIICILIMIISYLSLYVLDYMNRRENLAVTQEIQIFADRRAIQANIDKMKRDILFKEDVALEIDASNINQYLLMEEIEKRVPKGIQFIEQTSNDGRMTILGIATNDQEVADFAANLHGLKGAKEVWIESTKYIEGIEFQVSFTYTENGGDANEIE